MKWQSLYKEIIGRLRSSGYLHDSEAVRLLNNATTADPFPAFKLLQSLMSERGFPIGWNKTVRGNNILAWFGSIIVTHPFRALALEIEADAEYCDNLREVLLGLWQVPDPGSIYQDSSGSIITPESSNQLSRILYHLRGSGIWDSGSGDKLSWLRLLQRLNMDQREHPLIERWKWADQNGIAYLSDGGRFQIKRETVWMRVIEAGIDDKGKLIPSLLLFLRQISPDSVEVELPNTKFDDTFKICIGRLVFYGLANKLGKSLNFNAEPGIFPELVFRLWNIQS